MKLNNVSFLECGLDLNWYFLIFVEGQGHQRSHETALKTSLMKWLVNSME